MKGWAEALRGSLASATSLLALLLLEGHEVHATPSITAGTITFNGANNVLVASDSVAGALVATVTGGSGTTLVFGAPPTGVFSQISTSSFSISGNSATTDTAHYTFKPTTTGATSTTVTITDAGATPLVVTLTGTGVAPLETITTTNPYILIGQTGPVSLTVNNIGNGNLAGAGTINSLRGSVTSGGSVFVGAGGSFTLSDSTAGTAAATSATFGYNFTPTITGAASTTVVTTFSNGTNAANAGGSVTTTLTATGVAPVQSVNSTATAGNVRVGASGTATVVVANIGNGNLAATTGSLNNLNASVSGGSTSGFSSANPGSLSLASNATATVASTATTTLGYTFTPTSRGVASSAVSLNFSNGSSDGKNLSQSVAATVTGTGVAPVFTSSIQGAGTTNTPTAVAHGATGTATQTISFGTVSYAQSKTINLVLQNTTTDLPGSIGSTLTNLSILNFSVSGANAGAFSVSSLGSVITEGGNLVVPITIVGTAKVGALSSTLSIFTDESAAFGGTGDTFTYALSGFSVPEPTSLVALGAGLAGLASVRRRRALR
jgi:PEP-CTERM motif